MQMQVALHPEGVDRNFVLAPNIQAKQVALHPEGVDRNAQCGRHVNAAAVALHPEGVDRNRDSYKLIPLSVASPSTRRAWIEIHKGTGGTLYLVVSPSTRRAWIEMYPARMI